MARAGLSYLPVIPKDTLVFHLIEVLTALVLLGGVGWQVRFWLKGSLSRRETGSSGAKLGQLVRGGLAALASGGAWGRFFSSAVIQSQILRESRYRWVMHMAISWGAGQIFILASLGRIATIFQLVELPRNVPWFATLNDLGGLLLLLGIGLALWRRWVIRPHQLHTLEEDVLILLWLAAIALSGYFLEAAGFSPHIWPNPPSFLGYGIFQLARGLALPWAQVWPWAWWGHVLLVLGLIAYVPYSKLFHIITSSYLLTVRPLAGWDDLPDIAEEAQTETPVSRPRLLPTFTVRQLLELDACTRCGECLRWCEAYDGSAMTAPSLRLQATRRLLRTEISSRRHQDEGAIVELATGLFRCTLCARCRQACPVGINPMRLWGALREAMVARGHYPQGLNLARDAVLGEHNVVNYPNQERALWVDYMADAPEDGYRRPRAEVVYFVGCIGSFSPAVQSIPEAYAQDLTAAGVDFTILGDDEWCCGFPLIAAGMGEAARNVIEHNVAKVRETGARVVTFACPSCYKTWRKEYQRHLPGVELLHATQFLERLVGEDRLALKPLNRRVSYHDPCDLGRNSGEFEAPRRLLRALPGVELVEAAENRERARCCGGGGDLEISDPDLTAHIAQRTLRRFEETGAETVVTACQQCKRVFLAAAERTGSPLKFMDIAELVREAVLEGAKDNE